ncbi:MAG: polysaccharide biosynthesis/export family protein [Deltaproteobacteria bacterium]|nr:polysaccharide biosynthesis/export family protein [Deltaproteobacteria bacterium]
MTMHYPTIFSVLLLIPLMSACAISQVDTEIQRVTFPEIKPLPPGPFEAKPYRIRSGDVVSIKFIHNPELNETVPVRSDGRISLAMVGEVTGAGLELAELRATISEKYKNLVANTGYGEVLKEGDNLEIRLVYNPEYNQAVIIRSDGRISLPVVGEVKAAGLRPGELQKQLVKEYQKHLKNPYVAVLVGPNTAKKIFADEAFISVSLGKPADPEVFVGGEVLTPKAVKFEDQITTLQAIMQAGGVKETGDLSRVVILRRGKFEQGEWIQTNLSNPISGKSLQNDIALRDGDVVVVPMTGIAKVDLFVKQYIRDVLPVQSGFSISIVPVDAAGKR